MNRKYFIEKDKTYFNNFYTLKKLVSNYRWLKIFLVHTQIFYNNRSMFGRLYVLIWACKSVTTSNRLVFFTETNGCCFTMRNVIGTVSHTIILFAQKEREEKNLKYNR